MSSPRVGSRSKGVSLMTSLAVIVLGSILGTWGVQHFLWSTILVDGNSMTPTLRSGEVRLVSHWRRDYRRGDIVVLHDEESVVVKRIVGLPHERIFLRNGKIYVNDQPLAEPYLAPGTKTFAPDYDPDLSEFDLGPDEYLVLGDNREESIDSRVFGSLPRPAIRGIVIP
jgi:signal peptidase I